MKKSSRKLRRQLKSGSDHSLFWLVAQDEVKERCQNIAVLARLLANYRPLPHQNLNDPTLETQATHFLSNEIRLLEEALANRNRKRK